jgi:hypothetical protein
MTYSSLQQRIYDNKVGRGFNVTDVDKEIILMTEEFGELNDAYIRWRGSEDGSHEKMVDAVGDLQVYNLGLASMFGWNADDVVNQDLKLPPPKIIRPSIEIPPQISDYLPFAGRELGRIANAYKKSNKESVDRINRREEFRAAIGNLMGYCSEMFDVLKVEELSVLKQIVQNNETRTHDGQI